MKPICPDCKSRNILYRRKTKSFWCRVCGNEWFKKRRTNEKAYRNNNTNHNS